MNRLDWRDASLGTRVRVALWLANEVGEGNVFRMQQIRDAMPGVEQIDRRMRDLRPAGWDIRSYRDTSGLKPDELLLSQIGEPIWEPGRRGVGLRQISASVRREVLERDKACVRCGITADEPYPDDLGRRARLTVGHISPHKHGSAGRADDLVTECARCNEPSRHLTGVQMNGEQLWDRIRELPHKDKQQLLTWIAAGKRPFNPLEKLWMQLRQLPATQRDAIQRQLGEALAS